MSVVFVRGKPDLAGGGPVHRSLTTIHRPDHIQVLSDTFIHGGGRYLIEVLKTGEVHLMAIIDVRGQAQMVAEEKCLNGPALPDAVDRLVRASVEALAV